MRLYAVVLLWLSLLQVSKGLDVTESNQEEYGISTPQVIKLMHHFYEMQQKIDKHDEEMKRKELEITLLQIKADSCTEKDNIINLHETNNKFLRNQFELLINAMEEQTNNLCGKEVEEISKLIKGIKLKADKVKEFESQLKIKYETIIEKSKEIETMTQDINLLRNSTDTQIKEIIELKANAESEKLIKCKMELKKSASELKEIKENNAENLLELHNITLRDAFTFEVLLSSDIVYSKWIVIQQRINGGVNFNRNWTEYKDGFGDFWEGDFFLGLEKIHLLTSDQPHELYIHMQRFDGTTFYARYDEFAIAGEEDQYKITQLGGFSGSVGTTDEMRVNKNCKFSTFDRDNDKFYSNCARYHEGGWWYNACSGSFLNGKYEKQDVDQSIFWGWKNRNSLKQVRMMIRQKGV